MTLIDRLYEPCKRWKRCKDTRYEAADEIERLRDALRRIAVESSDEYSQEIARETLDK